MNDLSSSSASMLVHHREFYLPGGDVVFLVENSLFKVHKYFFERESSMFRNMLAQPVTPGFKRIGATDSNAIVLDATADYFEKFLWVFYNPKYSLYKTSISDWVKILYLAHMWRFDEIKALVGRELNELDMAPVDKIVLYNNHGLDRNLLIPQYIHMCLKNLRQPNESFVTDEEGAALGVNTVLRLFKVRETLLRRSSSEEADVEALVRQEFNLYGEQQCYSPPMEPASLPNLFGSFSIDHAVAAAVATPIKQTPTIVTSIGTPTTKTTGTPTTKTMGAPTIKTIGTPTTKTFGSPKAKTIGSPTTKNIKNFFGQEPIIMKQEVLEPVKQETTSQEPLAEWDFDHDPTENKSPADEWFKVTDPEPKTSIWSNPTEDQEPKAEDQEPEAEPTADTAPADTTTADTATATNADANANADTDVPTTTPAANGEATIIGPDGTVSPIPAVSSNAFDSPGANDSAADSAAEDKGFASAGGKKKSKGKKNNNNNNK